MNIKSCRDKKIFTELDMNDIFNILYFDNFHVKNKLHIFIAL